MLIQPTKMFCPSLPGEAERGSPQRPGGLLVGCRGDRGGAESHGRGDPALQDAAAEIRPEGGDGQDTHRAGRAILPGVHVLRRAQEIVLKGGFNHKDQTVFGICNGTSIFINFESTRDCSKGVFNYKDLIPLNSFCNEASISICFPAPVCSKLCRRLQRFGSTVF